MGFQDFPLTEFLNNAGENGPLHIGQDEIREVTIRIADFQQWSAAVRIFRQRIEPVARGWIHSRRADAIVEDALEFVCQANMLLLPFVLDDLARGVKEGRIIPSLVTAEQLFQKI